MDQTVSGPGKMSRRTDRGPAQKIATLPDAQYGEQATYQDLQQQAPLAQTPGPQAGKAAAPPPLKYTGTPMGAPSERPGEPVTAGASLGAGPGPNALGLQSQVQGQWQSARDMLNALIAQDPNNSSLAYLAARLNGRY